jgi:hypothetical protein
MKRLLQFAAILGAATAVLAIPVFAGRYALIPVNVPEPSAVAMLVVGIGTIGGLRYWLRKR